MADAPVVAPSSDLKPGWQTTELWIAMVAIGVLVYALHMLAANLPALLAAPEIPVYVKPLAAVAPVVVGWLVQRLAAKYAELRTQLKLPADPAVK